MRYCNPNKLQYAYTNYMKNLNQYVAIYKEQLAKGDILIAYNQLVKFVMKLRTDFMKSLADQYSFSGMLHGYMDYTYFYYSNDFLKRKKLKLGLVLNHLEMRFEIWLLGNKSDIQKKYWELLKDTQWNQDRDEMPQYAILEAVIENKPDFDDLPLLAKNIEEQLIAISAEIMEVLNELD